jgi:diaminopimelate epimerase
MEVTLGTHGGPRTCRVIEANAPHFAIESGMGVPRIMPRTIVIPGVGEVTGAMVNVGNPHFVLFVDTADFSAHGMAWQQLGAAISTSPLVPHGTNVEFVRIEAKDEIAFRIFERGCGPTTSSGTGTCASATAAIALKDAARELTAMAEGGPQRVVWPAQDKEMLLTGPAEIVCIGEVFA